ncbi:hypothetical protein [Demequina sp. NBRC 110056]|uniref:hypothetical protein n=1 Tax=Demequina sp. NBRC 110056 TaxID=1570345 RepID=UPI000A07541D|nr:hypothetical protein [Demequina sp. NBRC 110056]
MTMPVSTLTHVAALAGAVPQLTVSLDTDNGATVIVGDFPEASLCTHAFRQVMADWPTQSDHAPCVEEIHFDGAEARGPVLATGAVRWFSTGLGAQRAVAALREARKGQPKLSVQVRFDAMLAVSVVRMETDTLSDEDLDEAAIAAYATCEAESLLASVSAAA